MASASRCSIAGQFTLYPAAVSRHVVERSPFRHLRPATPIPESITQPPASSPYPTHGRRAPRSRPAAQQHYQPLRHEFPIRQIEARTQPNVGLFGRGNETKLSTPHPQGERPIRPRHIRTPKAEPKPSSDFPARRPYRTRWTSPETKSDRRDKDVHTTADSKIRGYDNDEFDSTPYSQPRKKRPTREVQDTMPLSNLLYVSNTPSPRANSIRAEPQASNRWSFSSDSSTSSNTSWSSSSPTLISPTLASADSNTPWSCGCAQALENAQREKELWRRKCLDMEERLCRIVEYPSAYISDEKYPVYHDSNDRVSSVEDTHTVEGEDMGQTTVYISHEVIARDSRFASPHQRTRNLDGMLVVQRPSKERSTYEEPEWKKTEEQRQRKRARVFPMWAETAPRHMHDKQQDGIRFRFGRHPDGSSGGREQLAARRSRFSRQNSSGYHASESSGASSR